MIAAKDRKIHSTSSCEDVASHSLNITEDIVTSSFHSGDYITSSTSEDSGFDNGFLSDSSSSSGNVECCTSCVFLSSRKQKDLSGRSHHKCILNSYDISGHNIETISARTFLYLANCITKLNLSNNNLSSLPQTLCQLKNLEELNLSFNEFYCVPNSWKVLHKLKVLKLSHNRFSDPPSCLELGMEHLVHLDLSYNKISEFANSPKCLTSLQYLNLSNNNFLSLPLWIFSDRCRSLAELDMSFNFCFDEKVVQKHLPYLKHHRTSALKTLQRLDISNTGCKLEMISYLSQFESLESLYLGNVSGPHSTFNHFWEISIGMFFHPANVVELHLPNIGLAGLPENIFELKNLKILDLSQNHIDWLPESFGKLSSLEELIISKCNVTYLPENFNQISSLKKLLLDHNKLTDVRNELTGLLELKWLDLYDNMLEEFPIPLENLMALEKLDVADNYVDLETVLDCMVHGERMLDVYNRLQASLRVANSEYSDRKNICKVLASSWDSYESVNKSYYSEDDLSSVPEPGHLESVFTGDDEENWEVDSSSSNDYFDPSNVPRYFLTPGQFKFGWKPPIQVRECNIPISLVLSGFVYVPGQAHVQTSKHHRVDLRSLPCLEGQFSDSETA
ncbi:leucine-rich repeat-containing protein 40-like isoform X2 [Homalodisca vitripennis]|uniref:leucine-rich repeat-containing protein 40-like isoform X2 n=1 Tax=Homalodisca vitripennis TaxID=197043 RepID=UPI001EEC8F30|nr:leucine-rich repeat-containing protein 40-like isoform X2 [Homalodisca vitripennis]